MLMLCVFKVIKAKVLGEENVDAFEKRYKVKVLENYKVSTLCQLLTPYRPPSLIIHNIYIPIF